MHKLILTFTIALLLAVSALAQDRAKARGAAQAESKANAQANTQSSAESVALASGTQLSAELLTTLDAKQAKPGDEFRLRVLKPVVVEGKRVVDKGTTLVGRVTESTKAEGKQGVSQLKLAFDQLRNNKLTLPFSATIEQITSVAASSHSQIDEMGAETRGSTSSQTNASGGSGGGLLGGVTGGVTGAVGNTVGGVVGTTGNTVGNAGSTVGGATQATQQTLGHVIATSSDTLNSTTAGAGQATRMISISSNSSAQASGSSTLSLTGRNVRIEKGAVFLLRTDKSVEATTK